MKNLLISRRWSTVLSLALSLATITASAAVTGTKTALVMLVSLTDAPIDCSISEVNGFYFTNSPLNVDSFFDHSTWGNVRWSGNVIAVSVNFPKSPCSQDAWANAADAAALAQGFNPSTYTARIYAFPSASGSCGYALATGNRVMNWHCTDLFAYGHEVGHTIGMHHASTDGNNDGIIDAEYGGLDDCMGNESFTHNAPHKIWGGWLPEKAANGGWRQINTDGTYQISPLQINPAGNPPFSQALKIIPPTGWPYFISYRQALDFDQGWTAAQVGKDGRSGTSVDPTLSMTNYPYSKGVGIHRHNGASGIQTLEIGVLADNQQFIVPGTGIIITQSGHDTNQVTVTITGFNGGSVASGVTFYQHANYGGSQSQPLTAGDYTLAQLQAKGVLNDWASSCKIPGGFTVTMFSDDNFAGNSWTLTADTASFSALTPSANDVLTSCRITGGANTPPPAPTGLSAVAGDGQATLSWTATPGATSYNVKRSTTSGGPYTTVATPAVSAYVNTGLANGVTYYYVVSAVNSFGESANSSQASATPTAELVAHWKFDENSGTATADASGNNNTGTLVNGPAWVAPGKAGAAALSFTASSQQSVTANSSSSLNNPVNGITIAAWVNATDWSGNRRIVQKGNGDNQYRLLAENSQMKFHLNGVNSLTTALPATGTWVHVAATWDGSTMTIYYGGVQQATLSAAGSIVTTADVLAIGKKNTSGTSGDYFNGALDDVRIYNRALSAAEINAIIGVGTPPPTPTGLFATPGDSQVSLSWNASSGATSYNVKRSTTSGGPYTTVSSPTGTSYIDTGLVNGTTYYYVVSAVNTGGESANSSQVSATPAGGTDLVAHWDFDAGSGTTAADASGNNNTGTLVNSPAWATPGRLGAAALAFNATSLQAVSVAHSASLNPTAGITISAWINPADWNNNRRIVQKGNSDNQYRLLAEGGLLKFHLTGVGTLTAALPATAVWTHVAATWNGSTMALYTNGVLQASLAAGGAIATTTDPLSIGRKNATAPAGDHFNGQLDDVRIYNRALSAAEISAIMGPGQGPVILLQDGFETDFSKWTDGGATDWNSTTAQFVSGSFSAHAGSADNDLISDNLNTTGYSSMTIDFWYRDDDIDDSDDVYLQLYNGSTHVNRLELGNSTEDTWHHATITINNSGTDAQYFISNFRIKFEGTSIDSGESLWIDDVTVSVQ